MNTSAAGPVTGVGWLWATKPHATGTYTPDASFSYNSTGGDISVERLSEGYYQIDLGGLYVDPTTTPSNVQVSAVSTNGYCMIATWDGEAGSDGARMWVACYDTAGNPADAQFNLLYQSQIGTFGSHDKGLAFLWEGNPKAKHHAASPYYSFNSTGGANSITRTGKGVYTAVFPGLTKSGGTVQVTAVAQNPVPIRCKTTGWQSTSAGTKVGVLCFDKDGKPADTWFSAVYSIGDPIVRNSKAGAKGAYALADKPNDASVYDPASMYQYNGYGSASLTAQKTAAGTYDLQVPGASGYNTSIVFSTSVGDNSDYCNVVSWTPIVVTCYKQGGAAAKSKFSMAFKSAK